MRPTVLVSQDVRTLIDVDFCERRERCDHRRMDSERRSPPVVAHPRGRFARFGVPHVIAVTSDVGVCERRDRERRERLDRERRDRERRDHERRDRERRDRERRVPRVVAVAHPHGPFWPSVVVGDRPAVVVGRHPHYTAGVPLGTSAVVRRAVVVRHPPGVVFAGHPARRGDHPDRVRAFLARHGRM